MTTNVPFYMRTATFVLLLSFSGTVTRAQRGAAPPADITIGMSADAAEYCLGPYYTLRFEGAEGRRRGAGDITLRLPLKLIYENHRPEPLILPSWIHYVTRMTVVDQNGSTILRDVGTGGMDADKVLALPGPSLQFSIVAGSKFAPYTGVDGVVISVLDRSLGLDLRGKTIQIAMTRDFRSLSEEVTEKLNERWKGYGTVWTGVAESNTVTFHIPDEPLTRNCNVIGIP